MTSLLTGSSLVQYRTEENFGGKKLWWVWQINSNSPKNFFALIAHCSILQSVMFF